MCDCLELGPPFASNWKHSRHETRQACAPWRNVEIARCGLYGHDRCERAKWLAVLDFAVEPITHFGRMGRRQDAAVAKRARPELKRALHPPHDSGGRQIIGNLIDERAVLEFHGQVTVFSCEPGQLRSINRRPPKRMVGQIAIRVSEVNAVAIKSRANCASSITRRGRDKYALKT